MKKLHKMMKAFAVSVALALVFCMIPVGSVYAETNAGTGNGSENGENGGTPSENPETVQITIDNTNSHVGVRFYQDTNNVEEIDETDTFKWIAPGTNETISVPKDAKARIRVYIQANGYYIPEDYHIDGVEKITNDIKNDLVNFDGSSQYKVNYLQQYMYTEFSGNLLIRILV